MHNSNCLLILSELNTKVSVLQFLNILLTHFNENFVLKLLQDVDNDNDSVFTMINKTSNKDTLIELLEFLAIKFGNSELKPILWLQNNKNETFLDQVQSFKDEELKDQVADFIRNLN